MHSQNTSRVYVCGCGCVCGWVGVRVGGGVWVWMCICVGVYACGCSGRWAGGYVFCCDNLYYGFSFLICLNPVCLFVIIIISLSVLALLWHSFYFFIFLNYWALVVKWIAVWGTIKVFDWTWLDIRRTCPLRKWAGASDTARSPQGP